MPRVEDQRVEPARATRPRQRYRIASGRSPGLRVVAIPGESPSRANAQWQNDSPQLDHRCGGSVGFVSCESTRFAPTSRFIPRANAVGTPKAVVKIQDGTWWAQAPPTLDDVCRQ